MNWLQHLRLTWLKIMDFHKRSVKYWKGEELSESECESLSVRWPGHLKISEIILDFTTSLMSKGYSGPKER